MPFTSGVAPTNSYGANPYSNSYSSKDASKSESAKSEAYKSSSPIGDNSGKVRKTENYGQTIGKPSLSDNAAKYYDQLKSKFGDMDFILVSKDQKDYAMANASRYGNSLKPVVLIDEDKIEKMASDENYKKQIENTIAGARSSLSEMKSKLEASGQSVASFGMKVNDDGTASFFAALKDSSDAQKERMEKKAEAKKAEKKADAKKAEKKRKQEQIENARSEKSESANKTNKSEKTTTFTANSIDELMNKISDYALAKKSDSIETESEQMIGHNIDFKG